VPARVLFRTAKGRAPRAGAQRGRQVGERRGNPVEGVKPSRQKCTASMGWKVARVEQDRPVVPNGRVEIWQEAGRGRQRAAAAASEWRRDPTVWWRACRHVTAACLCEEMKRRAAGSPSQTPKVASNMNGSRVKQHAKPACHRYAPQRQTRTQPRLCGGSSEKVRNVYVCEGGEHHAACWQRRRSAAVNAEPNVLQYAAYASAPSKRVRERSVCGTETSNTPCRKINLEASGG